MQDTIEKVDVAIVTIREDEFLAVLERFPDRRTLKGRNIYELASVRISGRHTTTVAVCRCPDQGNNIAQSVVANVLDDLDPPWLLLVGIGGGIPSTEYTLGDVVLGTRLVDFSVTATLDGVPQELDTRGGYMHRDVRALLANLPAQAIRLSDWRSGSALGVDRPDERIPGSIEGSASDKRFYGSLEVRADVYRSLAPYFGTQPKRQLPIYTERAIASGNTLVKSTELVASWRAAARQIAAIEMELAGAFEAVHDRGGQCRLLAIRGLSDVVGFKRRPEWTAYACHTAASLTSALIQNGIFAARTRSRTPPWWLVVLLFLASLGSLSVFLAGDNRAIDSRQRYAFALGHSLAVSGLDTSGSTTTIFEKSVRELGFPPSSVQEMVTAFGTLDRTSPGVALPSRIEEVRAAFEATMLAHCRTTFGARLAEHVELGARTSRLLLILKNWTTYPSPVAEAEASALHSEIRTLSSRLPSTGPFYAASVRNPVWTDDTSRRSVEISLESLRRRFDMEPFHKE